ncbi:hypothetical protein CH063_06465, partial [Colletotrichum higginsianum]
MNTTPSALETAAANTAWSRTLLNLVTAQLFQVAINTLVVSGLSTLVSVLFDHLISISPSTAFGATLLCKLTSIVWAYYSTKGTILR